MPEIPASTEADIVLGLTRSARCRNGLVRVGDRVVIEGIIQRIHESGFCVLVVAGKVGQPAVIVHAQNLTRKGPNGRKQ